MTESGIVAICQHGGEFSTLADGSMLYNGGEAHVIDIDQNMLYEDFKSEIASVLNIDVSTMAIKYFLPNNKRTLITVSCDKDLKRMIALNAAPGTVDIFILNKPDNRATRSVVADSGTSASVTITDDQNFGPQKRPAGNTSDSRSKSKPRLENPVAPEISTIADIDNNTQTGLDVIVPVDMGNGGISLDLPVIPIATSIINTEEHDPCVVNDIYNSGNELATTDTVTVIMPYQPSPDDIITGVGQEFDNVKDFRDKLAEFAITKGFAYKFIKNESTRLTVKCTGENCPWRLHASQLPRRKKFMIKRFTNVHTCGGCIDKDGQRRVTKKLLVSFIKEKLRFQPEIKPKEIAEEIYREYGVNVNYFKIWRAKTDAEKELFNTHLEACNQLPWFCERILESNPGSVVTLATSDDSKFRVFVSFHASLHGFEQGCRPLLILDRIPLKKSSQLKLLAAAGVDGDDGIFPVAFAAVEDESYQSWKWFLDQLKYAVTTSRTLTFVSNRQNGLPLAVAEAFPESYHGYCLINLLEDFRMELRKGPWSQEVKDELISDFECAAQACMVEEFNAYIEKISQVSKEAADWVMATEPEHWSNALFKGARYNHISADIIEFSDWISVKQESSVLLMIDALRSKTGELMQSRRETATAWEGVITPYMEQKLKKEMSMAHKFEVLCSSETVFEVRGRTINVVNIGNCECTCRRWQITGLPCMHAIAVFEHTAKSVYDYCSQYFRVDVYRLTYSESVNQILEAERMSSLFRTNVYPPPTRTLKWPRRKRDRRKQGEVRALHCSRCKQAGHNKATCEAYL